MTTTTLDHFRHFMEPVCSPDSFINMGFYWMIGAALQRRVWMGSNERPLYPNQYVVLCAEPGIGKGLTIKPIDEILRFHKIDEMPRELPEGKDPDDYLAIPVAADTVTFEALTRALARAIRRVNYNTLDAEAKLIKKSYSHNSIAFCLEEMSSLFKKKQEDVAKLLLKTYDCGAYKYETKNKGTDVVPRTCVNLLAGTTPSFMEQGFNEAILSDGWASRTIFVVEHSNRFESWFMPEPSESQFKSKQIVVEHVGKLTKLYGMAVYSPEAYEFIEYYSKEVHPLKRHNAHPKIKSYYARKNIHIMKLACAIHFSRGFDLIISREEIEEAIVILDDLERRMAYALEVGSKKNPLEELRKRIVHQLLSAAGLSLPMADIIGLNIDIARESEVREVLGTMRVMAHVDIYGDKYKLLPAAVPRTVGNKLAMQLTPDNEKVDDTGTANSDD